MTSDESSAKNMSYTEFSQYLGSEEHIRRIYKQENFSVSDFKKQLKSHDESIKNIDKTVKLKKEFLEKVWSDAEKTMDFLEEFIGDKFVTWDIVKEALFNDDIKETWFNSRVFGIQQLKSMKESIQNEQKLIEKFIEEMESCSMRKFSERCRIPLLPSGEAKPNIEKPPEVNFNIS